MSSYNPFKPSDGTNTIELMDNELTYAQHCSTGIEYEFDCIVGILEDLLMNTEFNAIQHQFFSTHCMIFDLLTDENKLSYTVVYQQYCTLIESYIRSTLQSHGFTLPRFIELCQNNQSLIESSAHDIFDVVNSITDYNSFKSLICEYKQNQQHNNNINTKQAIQQCNLDFGLTITKLQ